MKRRYDARCHCGRVRFSFDSEPITTGKRCNLFCKTCGVYPYHGDAKMGFRVNLGCVEGLDVFALEIGIIDGRSM